MSDPKPSGARTSAPDLDILGDQVTIHPAGYAQPPALGREGEEQNLVEHMARFRDSPFDFLREVSLHVSGAGWRAYDDVIGQPIYYSGFTENMKAKMMKVPLLKTKIQQLSSNRVEVEDKQGLFGDDDGRLRRRSERRKEIENSLREVAAKMTDDMICKMESKRFIRGAYYLATQLLTRAYHQGIHVSSEEVLRLRSVAEEAARKKQSIILLPCHRSHVDYVSLQIICYRLGIALPTVVSGDNLNFPVLGYFLQHAGVWLCRKYWSKLLHFPIFSPLLASLTMDAAAGAMWIRRSFAHDTLYTTLVQSYMDTLLQNGFNFECFIEGGRSRTGKLLPPKFGILSFLLDSVLTGRVEDAIVCPVSTQYDKVIETESYISELLGQPKPKENLRDFLSASSVLSLKLGRVDVRFHEPWSLKSFIREQRARVNQATVPASLKDPQSRESRIRLLRTLGFKVLADINAVSVVMPTALVGTILLTLRGRGVGKSELVRRTEWLSARVRNKGGRVAHFASATTEVVVERALEVLGPGLIGTIKDLPEITYYAIDRFQLSFYRNMTIHLFISEALVSAAMYIRVKLGSGPDTQRITYDALHAQVLFLSQLFRGEFIYPTEGLVANLEKTLHGLEKDEIIILRRDESGKILTAELSDIERVRGRENYDFYCFLIWPFIESTWLGAVSLFSLTPPSLADEDVWLDFKQTQDSAQMLGKTLYHQGDLSYWEAVNKETLKNTFQLVEEEGIIILNPSKDPKIPSTVKLSKDWTPDRDVKTGALVPSGRLWNFIEKIAQSRREGKNRRDGATVSSRVLALANKVGRELFASAAITNAPPVLEDPHKKRRQKSIDSRARL